MTLKDLNNDPHTGGEGCGRNIRPTQDQLIWLSDYAPHWGSEMAGVGKAAREGPRSKKGKTEPERGPIRHAPGVGWQHGNTPRCPSGLENASRTAWAVWMDSWIAAFWTPADLPGLRQLIRLYDRVERGEFQRAGELRLQMDTYGITPKGQQDRRWRPPETDQGTTATPAKATGSYSKLKAVG